MNPARQVITTAHLIKFLQSKAITAITPKFDDQGRQIKPRGKTDNGVISVQELAREAYGIASKDNVAKMRGRIGGIVRSAIPLKIVIAIDFRHDGYTDNNEPIGHPKIHGVKIYDPLKATEADKQMLLENLRRLERRRDLSADQVAEIAKLAGLYKPPQ